MTKSEIYKGRKITTKTDRKTGRTASYVSGQLLGFAYGTAQNIQDQEMRALRGWIDAADERRRTDPTAYPEHFYIVVKESSR